MPMVKGQKNRNRDRTLSQEVGLMLLGSSIPSSIIMNKWHSRTTSTSLLITMSRIVMTNASGIKIPLKL